MGLEIEAKKPVVVTLREALPKAQVATPATPKPLPLPLPEPRSKKSSPRVLKELSDNADVPIRSRKSWVGSRQIKLACAGVVVALICVGGVAFLIARIQLAEQAKKTEATKDVVQAKPSSAKTPELVPSPKPAQATPPTNKPKAETKPDTPEKKPNIPEDNTKPKSPAPLAKHLGKDQWAVTIPGQALKVAVTASSEEEAVAKANRGEWNKDVPVDPPVKATGTLEVTTLIKQIMDKDETVRLKAAKELGRLKEKAKDAIPALKMASADQDEDVREVAKKSLAAIQAALGEEPAPIKPDRVQPDPAKVDAKIAPLIKDLRSKDNKLRLAAIAKLDEMGEAAKPAGADLVEFGMMATDATVRDAANNVVEKIEPIVYKELITIYIDRSQKNKDESVNNLALMGKKASVALPMLRAYHNALFRGNEKKKVPAITIAAMARILPEDEDLQQEVLKLVASDAIFIELFGNNFGANSRKNVIDLMHEMPIDNKSKYKALMNAVPKFPADLVMLIGEVAKLGLNQA